MIVLPKTIKEYSKVALIKSPNTIFGMARTTFEHENKVIREDMIKNLCVRQLCVWQQEIKSNWKLIDTTSKDSMTLHYNSIYLKNISKLESMIDGVLKVTGLTKEEIFK